METSFYKWRNRQTSDFAAKAKNEKINNQISFPVKKIFWIIVLVKKNIVLEKQIITTKMKKTTFNPKLGIFFGLLGRINRQSSA